MHASTAIAAAKAQQRQDLRGEHAKDAAQHPRKTQCAPASRVARPSQRVRERDTAPAGDRAGHASDDGIDWMTIGLGIAGSLLAVGGIAALSNRSRRPTHSRVSV